MWRLPSASQGEICNINVYPRQLKVIAQGLLWGAAMHIIYDWGPELRSVRKELHTAVWSSRTPMNPMSNFSKSLYRLPDSSIHRIGILFHTLYNKQSDRFLQNGMVFFAILKLLSLSAQPIQCLRCVSREKRAGSWSCQCWTACLASF